MRSAVQENLRYSVSQHFHTHFSNEKLGSDIRVHFSSFLKEVYPDEQSAEQAKLQSKKLLQRKNAWLAEVHTDAFMRASEEFDVTPLNFPTVFFERLRQTTLGQFEPKTSFVVLRLQEYFTYLEILRSSHPLSQEIAAEVQMELTIYEEMAHYFQHKDVRNAPHFESYGKGWDALPPEEKHRAYISHPLEREAKLFANQEVMRKLEERIQALESTNDEDEMRRRAYYEYELSKIRDFITYLSSL
jgi:hypothetical protein